MQATKRRSLSLLLLILASIVANEGYADTPPAVDNATRPGPTIDIPAGNKDRGIRLNLRAQRTSGSMQVRLKAPGNGTQTVVQCSVENTHPDRWCDVTLELDIETDKPFAAHAEYDGGQVEDAKITLIEAASNHHYGDNIQLNYDRDLRLKAIVDDDTCVAAILYGNDVVATGEAIGEFSATFESTSHEFVDTIANWKAPSDGHELSPDGKTLTLTGNFHLNTICGDVEAVVNYTVINNHVIRKTISFRHIQGPELFYSVDSFIASEQADQFFSWANFNRTQDGWLAILRYSKTAGNRFLPLVIELATGLSAL